MDVSSIARPFAAAFLLSLASCQTLPQPAPAGPPPLRTVAALLADELVGAAERRLPLGSMQVVIGDVIGLDSPAVPSAQPAAQDMPGRAMLDPSEAFSRSLERELAIALSTHLYVFESPEVLAGEPFSQETPPETLESRTERLGATHVVVGTWSREREGLEISLRLVDLESQLIVAPARALLGYIPVELLPRILESDRPNSAVDYAIDARFAAANARAEALDMRPVQGPARFRLGH